MGRNDMTAFDRKAPSGSFQRWKARIPFLALSIVLLASLISGVVYHLRPTVEARAIVNVSDGALTTIIPEIAPDFAYAAPTADKVASWLEEDILDVDHSVEADGRQLAITIRDRSPSRAFEFARQAADDSIAYLADHRPHLLRDVKAWFDIKLAELETEVPANESSPKHRLFNLFEDALVDAKIEAQTQYAFLKSQAAAIDVAFVNGDGANDRSRRAAAFGRITPRDQVLLASQTYRELSTELDQLQAQSPVDAAGQAALQAQRSTILESKATLIANDAWVQPVAWLHGPVTVTEQPFWARLPFFVPASLALALATILGLTWLFDVLRPRGKGGASQESDDQDAADEQVFDDPYWPARKPL